MKTVLLLIVNIIALHVSGHSLMADPTFLIFRIDYKDYSIISEQAVSFNIISFDSLLKIHPDSSVQYNPPILSFYITKNGGYYAAQAFDAIYTASCCIYHDISTGYTVYFKDTSNFSRGFSDENLFDTKLKKKLSYSFKIKRAREEYSIRVWYAKVKYCVCPLFMESPQQSIANYNSVAYISNIYSLVRLNKKEENNIKNKLIGIVDFYH